MSGSPSRSTIYAWRQIDREFDRQTEFMAEEGHHGLMDIVFAEIESVM